MDNFQSLFDFLPIGAYRSLPDGRMLRANPALVALNGCSSEAELIAMVRDIALEWYVDPARRADFMTLMARDGQVVGFESEIFRHRSREQIWVRENAHVLRDAEGQVLCYEGTVEEITDRAKEREALHRSQLQLEQVVHLVPGVVYRIRIAADGTRRYTYVSDHVRQLYGLEPEEVMADGYALTRLRHPDDAEEIQRHLEKVIESQESLVYQVRVRLRDGTVKWVQTISAAAPAPEGERARVGVLFDITERKQAEAEVRAQADLWKSALEATGDGVWDWRVQDGVEILSPQCKALYGFEPHELPDTPDALDTRTHPDDLARMREDREAHFDGRSARYVNEHRVRCKDGQWKWILSRGLVISRDAAGQPLRMVGTHTDITAARLAEALRMERDRAAAADMAKSQFLSRVSHELRTPLNAILGFAQLLELDPGSGERQQGWNRQVLASGRHLLALMDDILDLSSAETGHMTVLQEPVPLRAVVEEAWAMVHSGANERGVRLLDDMPAGQGEQVLADRKRVKQIVSNLLSNAVKYNRAQGWVRVSLRQQGAQWALVVADSGPGLDAAQQSRLFNAFDRLGAERGPVQGTGLGLALSRQLAHAMRGDIDVSSEPGVGSSFTLRLPAA
jgi:PAS domain S-box-containing protein